MLPGFTEQWELRDLMGRLGQVVHKPKPARDLSNCFTSEELKERWSVTSKELIDIIHRRKLPAWPSPTTSNTLPFVSLTFRPDYRLSESSLETCCFLKIDTWFVEKLHRLRTIYPHSPLWLTAEELHKRWRKIKPTDLERYCIDGDLPVYSLSNGVSEVTPFYIKEIGFVNALFKRSDLWTFEQKYRKALGLHEARVDILQYQDWAIALWSEVTPEMETDRMARYLHSQLKCCSAYDWETIRKNIRHLNPNPKPGRPKKTKSS